MASQSSDLLASYGPSYFSSPSYLGEPLSQTGQLVMSSSSSILATTFQAGNNTAAVTYTFPTAGPAANNYSLVSTTTGTMSWFNLSTTATPQFTSLGLGAAPTFDLDIQKAGANSVIVRVKNTTNTADAGTLLIMQTNSSAAGDPYIRFNDTTGTSWSIGYDNSATSFKITKADDLSSASVLVIDSSQNIVLNADGTGVPKFSGSNSTGAGSALLAANCPAVTVSAPYTWVRALSSDGSTVYFPVWK